MEIKKLYEWTFGLMGIVNGDLVKWGFGYMGIWVDVI
jgi:hypothetical protein